MLWYHLGLTGKSHTMMGAIGTEQEGITPRMVDAIFESIQMAPSNLEFTVCCKLQATIFHSPLITDSRNPLGLALISF
jgi:hypothetical protein